MPRRKLRSQGEVTQRCRALRDEVQDALRRLPHEGRDPEVVDAVWRGEALGTLLWALQLAELPSYDRPFSAKEIVGIDPATGRLRDGEEIELERESALLWHWRARTSELQADGGVQLPPRFASFDQLIAATAMRGDFRAYGKVYRHLSPQQRREAHSIAVERHHALNWLTGEGRSWDDVPLDT